MLVKLDAIDSTNDFLKELVRGQDVENFTVVSAENQTNGKGQMGSAWLSEKGKNIIMSVLVKNFLFDTKDLFNLNIAVSLAVLQSIRPLNIRDLSIKWPNDIMSGDKKIGGILIENSFKSDDSIFSVVGIGLNVNQTDFHALPLASSLAIVAQKTFDKNALMNQIVEEFRKIIELWPDFKVQFRTAYIDSLFKKDVALRFQKNNGIQFIGTIQGVSTEGKLKILSDDGLQEHFDIKQIKMLY